MSNIQVLLSLGFIITIFISSIWYLYKNAPVVPNGSSVLHYHVVSAHTIYKKDVE